IPKDLEFFFETLNLTSSTIDLDKMEHNNENKSESIEEDATNEKTKRHQIAINELINKLKLCCSYKKKC
ncbi:36577_t:CDS:1, partial [Racocetra persica]